jgi:hypothetical protein
MVMPSVSRMVVVRRDDGSVMVVVCTRMQRIEVDVRTIPIQMVMDQKGRLRQAAGQNETDEHQTGALAAHLSGARVRAPERRRAVLALRLHGTTGIAERLL